MRLHVIEHTERAGDGHADRETNVDLGRGEFWASSDDRAPALRIHRGAVEALITFESQREGLEFAAKLIELLARRPD